MRPNRLLATLSCLVILVAVARTAQAQPRPVIERIEPTSGPPGTDVEIVGRYLDVRSRVFLGGAELPVTRRMPNRWTVQIPEDARSGPVEIRTPWGSFRGPRFSVTAGRPIPSVERIEPARGAPGGAVTIYGQNFSPRISDNRVMLGGRSVVVRSATPTALVVTVPSGAVTGSFLVRVAQAGETVSEPFTVDAATAISGFSPRVGPPGTEVVVEGTGFSSVRRNVRVFMNNRPLRVRSASVTRLVVTIPSRAASGPLLVDIRNGGRAVSSEPFTIQYEPLLRGFQPSAAPPGGAITIRGQNFGVDPRQVTVTLGGRPVVLRRVVPDEIDIQLPPGATGGKLEVTVGALGPVSSRRDLVVLAPVAVTGFSPHSGGPGTVVTISGQGFSADRRLNAVRLSDARAEVVAASPRELRVRVPSAPSGPLVVEVAGNGAARTRSPFIVTQPPFIARFEPASVAAGGSVTIHGTNFGTNPALVSVRLAGQQMTIRAIANDQIVLTVPPGARSGRIEVSVRLQGTARASRDIRVISALRVSSLVPVTGFPGTTVTIRGEGFAQGSTVAFAGAPPVAPASTTSRELRVLVPAGARSGPVAVRLPAGASVLAPRPFAVEETPAGTGITAYQAVCLRPGCHVLLRGYGFSPRARFNRVSMGGRPVRVTRATPTELEVTIPRVSGPQAFRVRVRHGGEATSQPLTVR